MSQRPEAELAQSGYDLPQLADRVRLCAGARPERIRQRPLVRLGRFHLCVQLHEGHWGRVRRD